MSKWSAIRDMLVAGVIGVALAVSITLLPWRPNQGWSAVAYPSVLFAGILLNAWFPAPNSLERHGRAGTFTLGSSATYFVVATVGGYGQWSQAVSLCLMLAGAGLTALAFRPYRPSSGP